MKLWITFVVILKEENFVGRKCQETFFATFRQIVRGIQCHENLKIKMSQEFKVANWLKTIFMLNNNLTF